jgi:hypothetical protein
MERCCLRREQWRRRLGGRLWGGTLVWGDESGKGGVSCVKVMVDTDQAQVLHLFCPLPPQPSPISPQVPVPALNGQ